jgi:hypothetical protein
MCFVWSIIKNSQEKWVMSKFTILFLNTKISLTIRYSFAPTYDGHILFYDFIQP